ncbi:MAG: MaoC/PaaZ C-terminal domain-containing protein [Marinovum algicola]|uniref:MaoC family dehydratase n=1 Tax=Roseobacteraceae TaxID=2854170 RepID=UPI0032EFEF6D
MAQASDGLIRDDRGMYYEDFTEGSRIETAGRTITEADIVNYVCMSGDFLPIHIDHEYCKDMPYGEVIAPGHLAMAVAAGLLAQRGLSTNTVIALLGMDNWRIRLPITAGMTLRVVQTVTSRRKSSKPGRGIVTWSREILDQNDAVVQTMDVTVMYKTRA